MNLILVDKRKWLDPDKVPEESTLESASYRMKGEWGKGYTYSCLCELVDLLLEKGVLSPEEALTVFKLGSKWRVK